MRKEFRLRVFENRVLRRIVQPKGNGVTGEWRKLHNEELNDLYSSTNVITVIRLRRMRWVGHVACMADRRGSGFWWGNMSERDYLEDPDVDGRIILRWIFRKWDVGYWDWIDLVQDRDRWQALVNVVMNLWVT
jgi:hypothetical protein